MIWKVIKYNLDDLGIAAVVLGGVFLLIQIIEGIVTAVVSPERLFTLCTPICLGASAIFLLICHITYPTVTYDLILRHSVTRKSALAGCVANMAVNTVAALVLSLLLGEVEILLASQVWARLFSPGMVVERVFVWWNYLPWIALGGVALILLGLTVGAAFRRFGQKAFWPFWCFWMIAVMLSGRIPWMSLFLSGLLPVLGVALGVALGVLTIPAVWYLLRASVRS